MGKYAFNSKDKTVLKNIIISEIKRVASELKLDHLPKSTFLINSNITDYQITHAFATWNRALIAAGLKTYVPSGFAPVPEEELLKEIIRLTIELKKPPTEGEMRAFGKYSPNPYIRRWGTFSKGREEAYKKYGFPKEGYNTQIEKEDQEIEVSTKTIPEKTPPPVLPRRKKAQYGEPIDFRGLRHAPINEQGVVYLFGMVSKELGFLIESIRTDYPDCKGKRCVDKKENRWENVLIEFEYKSSQFKTHGHSIEDCDLIVCWIDDWTECPIEVLELKSEIKRLKE